MALAHLNPKIIQHTTTITHRVTQVRGEVRFSRGWDLLDSALPCTSMGERVGPYGCTPLGPKGLCPPAAKRGENNQQWSISSDGEEEWCCTQ